MRELALRCSRQSSPNDAFNDFQYSSILTKHTLENSHNSYLNFYSKHERKNPLKRSISKCSALHHSVHNFKREKGNSKHIMKNNGEIMEDNSVDEDFLPGITYLNEVSTLDFEHKSQEGGRKGQVSNSSSSSSRSTIKFSAEDKHLQNAPHLSSSVPDSHLLESLFQSESESIQGFSLPPALLLNEMKPRIDNTSIYDGWVHSIIFNHLCY